MTGRGGAADLARPRGRLFRYGLEDPGPRTAPHARFPAHAQLVLPPGRRLQPRGAAGAGGGGGRHEGELLACGRRLGLRPVASAAAHFATPADYPAFRLATAVRQTTLLDQLPDSLGVTPEHHLLTAEEFRRRFHDLPEAVR